MAQFFAILWLKWKLALSQIRTPKAFYGQIALAILGVLILIMAIVAGVGVFLSMSFLMVHPVERFEGMTLHALLMLYLSSFYMMWVMIAVVPTRGGGAFELGMLLHYPVPLRRLFVLDVASEMFKGMALPMLIPFFMVHVTVPMVKGRLVWGLLPYGLSLILGALIIRVIELLIARVSQRGKSSGETATALAGVGVAGVILAVSMLSARFMTVLERSRDWDGTLLRMLPMSLTAKSLLAAGRGDVQGYAVGLAGLLVWILVLLPFCYRLWWQMAMGAASGGGRPPATKALPRPWFLAPLGEISSALFEKELKYLFRNSQVRALFMLSIFLVIVKLAGQLQHGARSQNQFLDEVIGHLQILEGGDMAVIMGYVALLYFALFHNLFGMDSGGMRLLVLAPVSRRATLVTRNLALAVVLVLQGALMLLVCAVLFRDVGLEDIAVVLLSLAAMIPVMAGLGNLCSIYFPRKAEFGGKITCSPWALLLLIVELPLALWPVGVGFYAALRTNSLLVKYGIMLAGGLLATGIYWTWLLPFAVRLLEKKELDVLQTVTGGDE